MNVQKNYIDLKIFYRKLVDTTYKMVLEEFYKYNNLLFNIVKFYWRNRLCYEYSK